MTGSFCNFYDVLNEVADFFLPNFKLFEETFGPILFHSVQWSTGIEKLTSANVALVPIR